MADVVCTCKRTIATGDRRITLAAQVNWGQTDLREPWEGVYEFCSFRCVAGWAQDRSMAHDGRFVQDGPAPPDVPAPEPAAASVV